MTASRKYVERVCRATKVLKTADVLISGVAGTATVLGMRSTLARIAVGAKLITGLYDEGGSLLASNMHYFSSSIVHGLWQSADELGSFYWHSDRWSVRSVGSAVIACAAQGEPHWWLMSTHTEAEILAELRATTSSWRITVTASRNNLLRPYTPRHYDHTSSKAREIIEQSRAFDGCRAWLLHGPPGAGKSVAAQQVAHAVGSGSVVTLDSESVQRSEAWQVLEVLRPRALVINDIDAVSEHALNDMLERLELAHAWAKVIVSTANTLTDLRGALLRPGRLADSAPVLFDALDGETLRAITPSVPDGLRDPRLLASYAAELEARAKVRPVGPDDLAELLDRAEKAGER